MYYDTEGCFHNEEDESERHEDQDGELSLHQFAKEPEAEEERFPNEEEEPEYQAEVHYDLDPNFHQHLTCLPYDCEAQVYQVAHVWLVQCPVLQEAVCTQVIEEAD